jgi:hypothetical protein
MVSPWLPYVICVDFKILSANHRKIHIRKRKKFLVKWWLYHAIRECLLANQGLLSDKINDQERKKILDQLERRRQNIDCMSIKWFWGQKRTVSMDGLKRFTAVSIAFIDHSIQANQRTDKLYQSYNLMSVNSDKVIVSNLSEMLEGQVAVLSSGYLDGKASLEIIDALRSSALSPRSKQLYLVSK